VRLVTVAHGTRTPAGNDVAREITQRAGARLGLVRPGVAVPPRALLAQGELSVGELVERLGLTQPQTSKHLRVLRDAGLVRVEQRAQRRIYAVDPGPMAELDRWLAPYRRLWNARLDRLGAHLDKEN
jgi:DNA-binding transcriptional ArsR family regulator